LKSLKSSPKKGKSQNVSTGETGEKTHAKKKNRHLFGTGSSVSKMVAG